ncbi:putative transcription initiation factor IIB [Salmonella phage 18-India]|nr:putative transcription initiation factor IIB [Salmonella phage 18-India]
MSFQGDHPELALGFLFAQVHRWAKVSREFEAIRIESVCSNDLEW